MTDVSDKHAREKLESLVAQLEKLESHIKDRKELAAQQEEQQETGYGHGLLYAVPCYRGSLVDMDIEKLNANLIAIATDHSNRRSDSSEDVRYQDHLIAVGEEGPEDPLVNEACSQIMDGFVEFTEMPAMFHTDLWCIANGPGEQIFPHCHNYGQYDYAVVCWTQVPEDSGDLMFFPRGMGTSNADLKHTVEPKAGDYLIFPGHILHGVRHNGSTELRVSFSGNISADPRNLADEQNDNAIIAVQDPIIGSLAPITQ